MAKGICNFTLWTEGQIAESLVLAGFSRDRVQCLWRNHSFAAFLALES